jgi:hypothetical protein
MRKAIFITGFENWGKTSIICWLFDRQKFLYGWPYTIDGINARFTVDSHSNDDLGGGRWLDMIKRRIASEEEAGLHLFAALCPTIHAHNDFSVLLSQPPFDRYDELHILLLEFKFDHHARLMIDNITRAGQDIPNIHFHVINADALLTDLEERANARQVQVMEILRDIFN